MDNGEAGDANRTATRLQLVATGMGLAGAALLVGILWGLLHVAAPRLYAAQRASSTTFEQFRVVDGLRSAVRLDCVLAPAYVALGVILFSLFRRPRKSNERAWHPGAAAGATLLVAAGIADLVENLTLYLQLGRREPQKAWLSAMRAAGVLHWSLLAASAVALALTLLTRGRSPFKMGDACVRPGPKTGPHPWDPPKIEADGTGSHRLGVCLSGGGIRSAAFSLGGLQALQDKGILQNAEYLSAASGGGYLAAGWAVSDARSSAVATGQAWSQGSAEERWFRDHSSYLVPDLLGGVKGVGRLVGGVVVNFLVVWMLLFVIARPVGWAVGAVHPELAPIQPVALARDSTGALAVDRVEPLDPVETVVDGATVTATRYKVVLKPDTDAKKNQVCFDTEAFNPGDRQHCFDVRQLEDRPAIIEVAAGKGRVVVQPKAVILPRTDEPKPCADLRCQVRSHLEIAAHPKVALKDAAVHEPVRPDQIEVTQQVEVRSRSGLVGRPNPKYRAWMWQGTVGLLGAGLLGGLWVMGRRLRDGANEIGRDIALALAFAGCACLLVTIAIPALATWLPDLATNVPGTSLPLGDPLLPSGGLVLAVLAAVRQYLSGNKTGPTEAGGTSWLARVWKRLNGSKEQLSWYETSPTKIVLLVILVLGFVVCFVSQLQYPIANGPFGRLMGVSAVRDRLPDWAWWPEWLKFAFAAFLLGGFACLVDAHAWSLYPFYKRRLASAFVLERSGAKARPIDYDQLLAFTPTAPGWHGLPGDPCGPARPGPKLVLCCSVNLSESGVVPPGRRAASFTFDADYIGGPLVGYTDAAAYWAGLPPSRQRDITITSAMAISGAAFSPAMGKKNLGPVGSVLALVNLRLGVWLPHPQQVEIRDPAWWDGWGRRPGWPWFLREVLNNYRFQRRYLYVSDGGHWDNLGLVELLRRGCTQIICISAAGDGATSFGTLAEAIALAREELGVEITLDPSPLRPPATAPKDPPVRELRHRTVLDTSAPFASDPFQVGHYSWRSSGASGTIVYIETALTADLPFDVHGFAESEAVFPDDATGDQVFNHRQFEAFRALGYHQVSSSLR